MFSEYRTIHIQWERTPIFSLRGLKSQKINTKNCGLELLKK